MKDLINRTIRKLQELQLKRRRRRNNGNSNHYFLNINPDEGFGIVHKRYWHTRHSLDDQGIQDDSVVLPKGSFGIMDSAFENSRKAFQKQGFTYLESPYWYNESRFNYRPTKEQTPSIGFEFDTPKIKNLFMNKYVSFLPPHIRYSPGNWTGKAPTPEMLPKDWNEETYYDKIKKFSEKNDLVAILRHVNEFNKSEIWDGAGITLVDKGVYEGLPSYPKEIQRYYELPVL